MPARKFFANKSQPAAKRFQQLLSFVDYTIDEIQKFDIKHKHALAVTKSYFENPIVLNNRHVTSANISSMTTYLGVLGIVG